MASAEKKFDGYNPETNTLIDAKDWDGWPPKGQKWVEKKIVKEARNDLRITTEVGANFEYHVPSKEKAMQLEAIFERNEVFGIKIIITAK